MKGRRKNVRVDYEIRTERDAKIVLGKVSPGNGCSLRVGEITATASGPELKNAAYVRTQTHLTTARKL
jgi:hypothetical protein